MFYDTMLIDLGFKEPDFNNLRWVLRATPARPGVPDLLLIEDQKAIRTDGHRLHICHLYGTYPEGTYETLLNQRYHLILARSRTAQDFPDWKHTVPPHIDFEEIKNLRNDSSGYSRVIRRMNSETTLDYKYFTDLGNDLYTGYIYGSKGPVIFLNLDWTRVALIMPMRM